MHAKAQFEYLWGGVGDTQCDVNLNFVINDGGGAIAAGLGYPYVASIPGNTGLVQFPVFATGEITAYVVNENANQDILVSLTYFMDASTADYLRVRNVEWDILCA